MNFTSDGPIYLQIVDAFEDAIASGRWAPGDRLDAVRTLAKDYGVNPNTMQKALSELDQRGLTASDRTRGRFVTQEEEVISALRRKKFMELSRSWVQLAQNYHLSWKDSLEILQELWKGNSHEA
ncbi:MAG: GntR family transcriptional regulator [Tissierellia bacterium]|nr:GntR family transcriptional regulator [Tissierellia bacterium]